MARRDSLPRELRAVKDEQIRNNLTGLDEFRKAHTILFYASFRSEVDTFDLIRYSLSSGRTTVLPRVDREARDLMLFAIVDPGELSPGCWGIPEPPAIESRQKDLGDIDLIIVPGAAFDEQCNRVGYGGGYYDRLLARKSAPAIALSYEEQMVTSIPAEPHDICVDTIVTDRRIVCCHGCA